MKHPKKFRNEGNLLQDKMVQEGLGSYGYGLVALDQFVELVHRDCHKVMEAHLSELQRAAKSKLRIKDAIDDPQPNAPRLYENVGAWITSGLGLGEGVGIFCGLNWREESAFRPCAVAAIEVWKGRMPASRKRRVINTIERLLPKRKPGSADVYAEFNRYFGFKSFIQNRDRPNMLRGIESLLRASTAVLLDAGGVKGLLRK